MYVYRYIHADRDRYLESERAREIETSNEIGLPRRTSGMVIVDAMEISESWLSFGGGWRKSGGTRDRYREGGGESSSLAYRIVHWRKLKPADH